MVYVDTSVLVALYTRERQSAFVAAWYESLGETRTGTATWAVAEVASALAIKRRTRQLDTRQTARAWRRFEQHCSGNLQLLPVDRDTFDAAARLSLAPSSTLRAGDALHLAVARAVKAEAIATLDLTMRKDATRLRMQLVPFPDR